MTKKPNDALRSPSELSPLQLVAEILTSGKRRIILRDSFDKIYWLEVTPETSVDLVAGRLNKVKIIKGPRIFAERLEQDQKNGHLAEVLNIRQVSRRVPGSPAGCKTYHFHLTPWWETHGLKDPAGANLL
jgi:hypothetical protein